MVSNSQYCHTKYYTFLKSNTFLKNIFAADDTN